MIILVYLHCTLIAGKATALDLGRMFDATSDLVTAGTGLSVKEEIQVGREIAGRTLGAAPLFNDAAQSYVNRVGRWRALQSERLSYLGEALTPRLARLPTGSEPGIKTISAEAGPARAAKLPPVSGANALQEESATAVQPGQKGTGIGVDPGQLLRGIFGR